MYSLSLKLDTVPKSLNKALRYSRYGNNRVNKQWDFEIGILVMNQLPPKPLEKARIRIVRHYWRTLDYDGLVGSMKPVVDALVISGVLASDSWKVLHKWDVDQVFRSRSAGPLLEIHVIELPETEETL